jgi:hypothetical protein
MIKIIALALTTWLLSAGIANATTCFSSPAEVRKSQPKAWPKWTYGPNREKCWYAGEKPVFAKTPPGPTAATDMPVTPPTTAIEPELDGMHRERIRQPWALEYRWAIGAAPEWR